MTKEQERARAKRRHERQQANLATRQSEQHRNLQIVAVVVVLLAIVGGLVWLSNRDDTPDAAVATASSTPTPGDSATTAGETATTAPSTSSSQAAEGGCPPAPGVPGTAAELSKPSDADIAKVEGKTVVATIETNCGPIELTLDGAKAPATVASFAQLARVAYWKDAPCHRLTTEGIFVLQCGDPTGTGSGTPGYGYGIENAPADGNYPRGTVAMARTQDPESNGGQFFIVYKDSAIDPSTGGYSIFGTVTKGLDIVDRIAAGGLGDNGVEPKFPISFLSVTTETKG